MLSAKTGKRVYREKTEHCIQYLNEKHKGKVGRSSAFLPPLCACWANPYCSPLPELLSSAPAAR